MEQLLDVKNLTVHYRIEEGWLRAVSDVSFNLGRGETLGLVGESACGKTTVMSTIMKVLPYNARIISGNVIFDGVDLVKLSEDEMRKIRLERISLVSQGALNALNPVIKIGDLLTDFMKAHTNSSEREIRERLVYLMDLIGIPESRLGDYPHQLSGGMKQRVMIAAALLCKPDVIIADEPTTALDVVVQDQILEKIRELQRQLNIAMIIISHDISVIAETCERIAIMYGGRIFEYADTVAIFKDPHNPYTIALLQSFPSIIGPKKKLVSIKGSPPKMLLLPKGCIFEPRCPVAREICKTEAPPWLEVGKGHYSLCHFC